MENGVNRSRSGSKLLQRLPSPHQDGAAACDIIIQEELETDPICSPPLVYKASEITPLS